MSEGARNQRYRVFWCVFKLAGCGACPLSGIHGRDRLERRYDLFHIDLGAAVNERRQNGRQRAIAKVGAYPSTDLRIRGVTDRKLVHLVESAQSSRLNDSVQHLDLETQMVSDSLDEIREFAERTGFPLIVKPRASSCARTDPCRTPCHAIP